MIWKQLLILASWVLNLLVLIGPGFSLAVWWVRFTGTSRRYDPQAFLNASALMGLLAIAIGACNIVCVELAHVSRGRRQRVAIIVACVVSFCVTMLGLLLAVEFQNPLFFLILGAVGCTTAGALLHPRRKPTREGICVHCGYDLAGLSGGLCPECGKGERDEVDT